MLRLNMFEVFALTFWGRWCEISLCCFHPFGYDLGWYCTLFVMIFHMLIDALISHFETFAFMCGDMVRASAWSVVISLVCGPVVLSALFDLVCLVWFRMLWTVCADWLFLVSSVW